MKNAHSRLLKELVKGPEHKLETVADALDHISALTKAASDVLEVLEEEADKDRQISSLKDRIRYLESSADERNKSRPPHRIGDDATANLERVLRLLKRGDVGTAIAELDIILCRADGDGRNRMGTAAVML